MRLAGRVVIEEFECEALRDNPLGDPARREIPVYLPPGYDRSGRRYPVIYWLHGFTGTGLAATNYHPWVPSLPELIDRVIQEGAPPAILVMADGWTTYGGSQYINSTATGRYEDAVKELVTYIDTYYRTMASRKHGGLDGFLKAFREAPKKADDMMHAAMNSVAMAMAYSPNPESPYGFDPVVDPESGELIESVWTRWLEWDPVSLVERYAENLRAMRMIYFECGSRDQYNLHHGARILHRRMERLGIRHEYQEFDDDHSAVNYRYVESLRRLCNVLKA